MWLCHHGVQSDCFIVSSWCNNNLTLLWLVLLNIYTITFCVRIKEAKTAFLFLSLYLSGHQIFHCCPPWRLLGHGPLHLRSLLPFSISISSEIIKFFITALYEDFLAIFKIYWLLYITLIDILYFCLLVICIFLLCNFDFLYTQTVLQFQSTK